MIILLYIIYVTYILITRPTACDPYDEIRSIWIMQQDCVLCKLLPFMMCHDSAALRTFELLLCHPMILKS